MAVTHPRNRALIFRLTEDEYAELQTAWSRSGARSFSDFARAKLLGPAHPGPMERQLSELKGAITRLVHLLEDSRAGSPFAGPAQDGSKDAVLIASQ